MKFSPQQRGTKIWRKRDNQEWEETGIPDSYLPQGLCPRCGLQSSFEVRGSFDLSFDPRFVIAQRDGSSSRISDERLTGLTCRGCSQGMAVVEEMCHQNTRPGSGAVVWRANFAWPLPTARISSDVPAHITAIFAEAVTALAARIPRAASLMARATLEAITVDKGEAQRDNLKTRIRNLASKNILQPDLAAWAEEIRLLGNAGAHDVNAPVSLADVEQLVSFIRELLKYFYELPAELARRRATT